MLLPYPSVLPGIIDTGIPRFVVADITCPAPDKAPRRLITHESCGVVAPIARDILFAAPQARLLPAN